MNEFVKYKNRVAKAKEKDLEAKNLDPHPGNKESVNKMCRPFEKGYFTLAIVGGMSAGKSTFLNAFLGKKDLLPTGVDQTTCCLTTILYSKEQYVEIEYMNGDKNKLECDKTLSDIKKKLLETVAVPQKYGNGFPVIQIINDILDDRMSRSEILNKVGEYDKIAGRTLTLDLEHFLDEFQDKSKFVKSVTVGLNIPELDGWRIVDTPGVCALGGIEKITRDFIFGKDNEGYDNVDAVLFVYNGSQSLQEKPALTDFIRDIMQRKRGIVSKRAFMIVTHSASGKFRDDPDYVKKANDQIDNAIPDDKIFCVDSNIELFEKYTIDSGCDFNKATGDLTEWPSETSQIIESISFKLDRKMRPDIPCNEDYVKEFNKISQFNSLRDALNEFIVATKDITYKEIIKLIKEDINNLKERKKDLLAGVQQDLEGILSLAATLQKRKEDRERTMFEFCDIADKLKDEYNKPKIEKRFKGAIHSARVISTFITIEHIKNHAFSIQEEVNSTTDSILNELSTKCSKQLGENNRNMHYPNIDFKNIVDNAKVRHTTRDWVDEDGFLGSLKRFASKIGGIFSRKAEHWGQKEGETTDINKVSEECKNEIVNKINERVSNICKTVDGFIYSSKNMIDETNNILQKEDAEIQKNNTTHEEKERSADLYASEIDKLQSILETII